MAPEEDAQNVIITKRSLYSQQTSGCICRQRMSAAGHWDQCDFILPALKLYKWKIVKFYPII